MQKKVSILVPVYNVEKYLRQCMDSIVNQTLKEIEIICVNDGSTDGSLDILKEYAAKDDRIVIIDKENGGYGMAMNIATDRATGEYIGIVEPDDYIALNMFEELYQKASENDLDFVKSDFYCFEEDEQTGKLISSVRKLTGDKSAYNVIFNPSETPDALKYIKNTWTGIYKRSFIEKCNIRYNETPGASYQDNGFWYQTFFFGKRAMIVDKPYYKYRTDNPNSSVKNPQKVYAINVEYDFIRNILTQIPERWEKFKGRFWYGKYISCIVTLSRISNEFKKEYTRYISKDFRNAYNNKEFNSSLFDKLAWTNLKLIMYAPDIYHYLHTLTKTKAFVSFKAATYGKKKDN